MAVVGVALVFVAGPVDELAFGAKRLVNSRLLAGSGAIVAVASLVLLLWSQASMGDSLRIGVDPSERTDLVTSGPFRWVRNPIYSAMVAYVAGTAMLVPNPGSVAAAVALIVGEELQVRRVEEPYLRNAHGTEYEHYAARAGRFLPRVGRLASPAAC
jgi:protein-S-isoprenylcysteine O-methyltransferase Ste14